MVCEMVQRGAGRYSSRDLVATQDNLGLDRSSGVSTAFTNFGAAMPSESLAEALALYADVVLRPHLPGDQLEDARQVSLQELRAAEDEPSQRVMSRLKALHYGAVLGRSPYGTRSGLAAITAADVRQFYQQHYRPDGAILAVAGQFQWPDLLRQVQQLFGSWQPQPQPQPPPPQGQSAYEHLSHPSQQTHIGFAFPAVPFGHDDYFVLRAAMGILSDGMSSRLFDRVREQRGLCYTVSAGCHSLRGAGGVFGYAGTTPERAQETMDVTLREIETIGEGVDEGELDRLKVRVQSSLIMEQESSASRASSMVSDWYHLGRVMPAEELERRVEAVTSDQIIDLWRRCPPADYRIVTLGPEPLSPPASAAALSQNR